jgi:hypothetical protein
MKADVELGVLNRGKQTPEPTGVSSTGLPIEKAVRRPMRIHFEPPADPTRWRLTGRVNWHSQHQDYGIVPTCEWANHEGLRIWLPARHKDFVAEFNYGADGPWRELILCSRRLLTGILWRSRTSIFYIAVGYLQLAGDAGI